MIEPTESESLAELDRFCDAMMAIKKEIDEVVQKKILPEESALSNAPHTIYTLTSKWEYQYSKEQAVFPLPYVKANKFWPSVRRVDDAFGDRNLHCSCAPIQEYQ